MQSFARSFSYCFAGSSELGTDANGRLVTNANSSEEISWNLVSRIFYTSKLLYLGISVFGALAIALICFLVLEESIAKNVILKDEIVLTSSILILGSSTKLFGNVFLSILTGANKIPLINNWESLFGFINLTSSIILFFTVPNIFVIIINQQMWYILSVVRNYFLVKKTFPNLNKSHFDVAIFKIILSSAWRSSLGILLGYGTIQITSLMLTRFESAEKVASYLLALRVVNLISDFSRAPFYSKIPEMTMLYADSKISQFFRVARKGMSTSLSIFALSVLAIGVFNEYALSLINSNTPFVSTEIWVVLSAGYFFERYGAIHIQMYSVSNHILWHLSNGITGLIYVACIFILYPSVGLISFPLAILISNLLFYCPFNSYTVYNFFSFSWKEFNMVSSLPIFIALLLGLIAITLCI
ncbi:MAG: hypothetical protein ABJ004_18820 [Cyclobacteriaceae bacterium]